MNIAISKNGVPIRLTDERWQHITTGHPEIAGYYYEIFDAIENADVIYEGNDSAKIAVKNLLIIFNKFVVVIYKEVSISDGFVITAYLSNKQQVFQNKRILWKQQK